MVPLAAHVQFGCESNGRWLTDLPPSLQVSAYPPRFAPYPPLRSVADQQRYAALCERITMTRTLHSGFLPIILRVFATSKDR